MEQFKYIQPLDQMARISRMELGEKLDEILNKVDNDNVGFVITDEGKDDLVLCPIRWTECIYDDDFGCIINSALRYAIGPLWSWSLCGSTSACWTAGPSAS